MLLRHYEDTILSVHQPTIIRCENDIFDVKLGAWHKDHKRRAALRHYDNQPTLVEAFTVIVMDCLQL